MSFREIIIGERLDESALTPLERIERPRRIAKVDKNGEKKIVRSGRDIFYRCLCDECGQTCVKMARNLRDKDGAKACPTCVKKRVKANDRFNLPWTPAGWERRRKLRETPRERAPD